MTRTITALFDSVEQVERAAHGLATRVGGVRVEVTVRAGSANSSS